VSICRHRLKRGEIVREFDGSLDLDGEFDWGETDPDLWQLATGFTPEINK
jgi:hypothetical protein